MRPPRWPWLLGLIGLALLLVVCYLLVRPTIEGDLAARTVAALEEAGGLGGVGVELDGRTVVLTGRVATSGDSARAVRAAAAVEGVAGVRSAFAVGDPAEGEDPAAVPEDALFAFVPDGDAFVLQGRVPDPEAREALLEAARAAFPERALRDELEVAAAAPGGWVEAAAALLGTVAQADGAGLVLAPSPDPEDARPRFELRGTVPDGVAQGRIEGAARAVIPARYGMASALTIGAAASGQHADEVEVAVTGDAALEGAAQALGGILASGDITFETGTARLTPSSRALLDGVAEMFEAAPEIRAEIQGHTDNVGAEAANQQLSERRAEAVRAYLVSRGVDAARLTARGFGSARPATDADSPEGRARNRRVVFRLDRR